VPSDRTELLGDLSVALRRAQRSTDQLGQAAQAVLGLNRTDGTCLDILDQHGTITAGELARESQLTTGAVTAVIDRLAKAGYARRAADPRDRRRVIVEITEHARERSWELFAPLAQESGPLLDGFTDDSLRTLIEFLRVTAEMQERHAERLRVQGGGT
jgi:DNA-binding MarR family transcriptional regulator